MLAADHGNVGDLAIRIAQEDFLAQLLPHHRVVSIPISQTLPSIQSIARHLDPSDVVTITGGGNMGGLYPDIEALRQMVIHFCRRARIVCFPQSLEFGKTRFRGLATHRLHRTYSAHPNLTVLARESNTLAALNHIFPAASRVVTALAPDTAFMLRHARAETRSRAGVVFALRNDREAVMSSADKRRLWDLALEASPSVSLSDTHLGAGRWGSDEIRTVVEAKLEEFARAELVITDRLHGMILSVVAGTPCVALPSGTPKLSQTARDWLPMTPGLRFLPDVEAVVSDDLSQTMNSDLGKTPEALARLTYSRLADLIGV